MIADELEYRIWQNFGLEPTREQREVVKTFTQFMFHRSDAVMILRGAAGTGKTTLAAALVRTTVQMLKASEDHMPVVLLAPTGRAAKVFSLHANLPAYTIHRHIYRQKTFNGDLTAFTLNPNHHHDTLFVVDEASMISNAAAPNSHLSPLFGSGQLLDDLIRYVYSGTNCRLLLIGDHAQLPPVGETVSPALSRQVISSYGLTVFESEMNEVMRQSLESGILMNATYVRNLEPGIMPIITFDGFSDIRPVPGNELIEELTSSYSRVGIDDTIVVTRSNKRANIYNNGIRNQILDREEMLSTGDMLMIVKNNYFWTAKEEKGDKADNIPPFIANGDRAQVLRVRNVRSLYGLTFADVWLRFPDYDNYEMQVVTLLNTLSSEAPALTAEQQQQLFEGVLADYADIPHKSDRMKKVREDPYYNALQVKYAYAVTCHKAQGGQWSHVYVDQGYITDDMLTTDYIHWLYTAITRSTEKLYLVNWKNDK
ncbi:MAG: AAA family ATPase [Prevotella sp.]|nr:AAA family ATPase [Prevotella sp.]